MTKLDLVKFTKPIEQDTPKILKVLKEELTNDAKAVELFQQEANVLQQLNHPGIPKQMVTFHIKPEIM